jgi:hypothetical protein
VAGLVTVLAMGKSQTKGFRWALAKDDRFRMFSGSLRVRSESILFHAILCFGLGKVVCMEACVRGSPTRHSFALGRARHRPLERWNIEIIAINRGKYIHSSKGKHHVGD